MSLCVICGKNEANFEGVICTACKSRIDQEDFEEEREAFESDMLQYNHKGEFCWLTGKTFCQEGWCQACQIYLDWKKEVVNA